MTQTRGKTMKAVAIDRFGGVETLKTQELPIPAAGDDEVLIHVEAAGVGVWDPFEREGGFAKEFNIKPESLCFHLYWDPMAPALLKPWDPK
jgi:NADPH:quinone reductase